MGLEHGTSAKLRYRISWMSHNPHLAERSGCVCIMLSLADNALPCSVSPDVRR